jgi:hypothetical protein
MYLTFEELVRDLGEIEDFRGIRGEGRGME